MHIRKPAVAGQFYPLNKKELEAQVNAYLGVEATPIKAKGIIAPHAGYMFSGHVAGATYARTIIPKRNIVLSPSHTGIGAQISIMSEGAWEMPSGRYQIDTGLAQSLMKHSPDIEEDLLAHMGEHSLEVQLPFIAARNPDFKFVPITIQHISYGLCEKIGQAIAQTIRVLNEDVLIIASSDMTHHESQASANKKDYMAIDCIKAMDPEWLYNIVRSERISMCGVIPSTIMLVAAIELGAKSAELVKYATSGDIIGDYNSVVGYAGIIVS
ncbi:AmmeMemoRadiSam system protein B [bacterium]|nr:AmmeMemoRadiSam system protein B [bacterium]